MLEERKAEVVRDLEQAYSSKQVSLSVYSQKAQETVDKILQVEFDCDDKSEAELIISR